MERLIQWTFQGPEVVPGGTFTTVLLVEREDLQFHRQINSPNRDIVGHSQHCGRKVEDRGDAAVHHLFGHLLGSAPGRGNHTDDRVELRNDAGQIDRWTDRYAADFLAALRRVSVEQCGDSEAAGAEPTVCSQRASKVADTDNDDRPVLREAELAADLVEQVLDVVADSPRSVRTQIAEILANLGRVHRCQFGEGHRRHVGPLGPKEFNECPVIQRKTSHRRVRDAFVWAAHGSHVRSIVHAFTRSQFRYRLAMLTTALAATAALVSLVFAFMTHERWLVKRRPYERTWTWALGSFCVGAFALAWGSAAGWNGASFRLFYLFGAIVNVPLLAVGQVELLSSRRWVRHLRPWVLGAACFSAGVLAATPLRAEIPTERLPQGKEVFGAAPRILAGVASAGGALVVFVGAAYSLIAMAVRGRTGTRVPRHRVGGTALIALGTVLLSASGSLNKRFGEMTAFAITLTAGVVVLFVGFLVSTLAVQPRSPAANRGRNHAERDLVHE